MTSRIHDTEQAGESGFSLIEMLVVLAILALVAGLTMPNLRGTRQPSAMATAREIEALFQRAHVDAIAHRRNETVTIDVKAGTVLYGTKQSAVISSNLSRHLLVGRELVSNAGTATIFFQPDGSTSGAELELRSEQASIFVSLPWLTGVAKIDTGTSAATQ